MEKRKKFNFDIAVNRGGKNQSTHAAALGKKKKQKKIARTHKDEAWEIKQKANLIIVY